MNRKQNINFFLSVLASKQEQIRPKNRLKLLLYHLTLCFFVRFCFLLLIFLLLSCGRFLAIRMPAEEIHQAVRFTVSALPDHETSRLATV